MPTRLRKGLILIVLAGILVGLAQLDRSAREPAPSPGASPTDMAVEADVVVYGATPSGIMAAIAASEEGARVALVEPTGHIGGMMTSGLSASDTGNKATIGGLALEFHQRTGLAYYLQRFGVAAGWNAEPHVAAEVFETMLSAAAVPVYLDSRLDRSAGVERTGLIITAIRTEDGRAFRGSVFIDASYEGDLMAAAGVSYRVGRESADEYGEPLAGVGAGLPHDPPVELDDAWTLLGTPTLTAEPGEIGSGDLRNQPYNFRLCFSSVPGNQAPFPTPTGYDSGRFRLVSSYLSAIEAQGGTAALSDVLVFSPLPNNKVDVNAVGVFSTDLIGGSWDYPDATDAERERIWSAHYAYVAGLVHYLATDPLVPRQVADELNRWGLCRDEWTSTDHWPPQLYVREARRMVNGAELTQADLLEEITKADAIGLGSYHIDVHPISMYRGDGGLLYTEGRILMEVPAPYQIPYSALLPADTEVSNLLVSVTVAASHVAAASLRMEPQYMVMGEAAGVAAALAVSGGTTAGDVPISDLQTALRLREVRLDIGL